MRGAATMRGKEGATKEHNTNFWKTSMGEWFDTMQPREWSREFDAESSRSGASGLTAHVSSKQVSSLANEIQSFESRCAWLESRNEWLTEKMIASKKNFIRSVLNGSSNLLKRNAFDGWRKAMTEDHLEFQLHQQTESLDQCQRVAKDLGSALGEEQDARKQLEAALQTLRDEIQSVTASSQSLQQHIAEQQAQTRHLERRLREAENHMNRAHSDAANVASHVGFYERRVKELDVQHKQALFELQRTGQYTPVQAIEAQIKGSTNSATEHIQESRRARSEAQTTLKQMQAILPSPATMPGAGMGSRVSPGLLLPGRDRDRDASPERERPGFLYEDVGLQGSQSMPLLPSSDPRLAASMMVAPPTQYRADLRATHEPWANLPEVTGHRVSDVGQEVETRRVREDESPDDPDMLGRRRQNDVAQDRLASWTLGDASPSRTGRCSGASDGERRGRAPSTGTGAGAFAQAVATSPLGQDSQATNGTLAAPPAHGSVSLLPGSAPGPALSPQHGGARPNILRPTPVQGPPVVMSGTLPAMAKAQPGGVLMPRVQVPPLLAGRPVPIPIVQQPPAIAKAGAPGAAYGAEPWWVVRRGAQSPGAPAPQP